MTKKTSVQLTEATERQIEALQGFGFGTRTDSIRIAIDCMYRVSPLVLSHQGLDY